MAAPTGTARENSPTPVQKARAHAHTHNVLSIPSMQRKALYCYNKEVKGSYSLIFNTLYFI